VRNDVVGDTSMMFADGKRTGSPGPAGRESERNEDRDHEGIVEGLECDGVMQFLGVPFAVKSGNYPRLLRDPDTASRPVWDDIVF
jgi:hypothetical protein